MLALTRRPSSHFVNWLPLAIPALLAPCGTWRAPRSLSAKPIRLIASGAAAEHAKPEATPLVRVSYACRSPTFSRLTRPGSRNSAKLGIELPIVQAPMGGAVGPALAAVVCNAGGLGMPVLWRADADTMRQQIREMHTLTSRPFGVNLVLDFPQEERLAVCLEERVPIISFFWRDPSHLVPRAKEGGAIVMHTVGSAADARRAVDAGVDVIVAQGWEAGGHVRGSVATMPLVPAVVDAVSPAPVVAAGGIADGRGLAAALALGAAGAWIGTRFLASNEAAMRARPVLST